VRVRHGGHERGVGDLDAVVRLVRVRVRVGVRVRVRVRVR
jgi:hypothetical protein